jgi:hypothetical protein
MTLFEEFEKIQEGVFPLAEISSIAIQYFPVEMINLH